MLLTLAEVEQIRKQGGDPADYVVMPVDVQYNPQGQLGLATVPTANGPVEVVIVSLALALPVASLRMSRLLDSGGRMPHPLEGILPMLTGARLVVPRARLAPELAAALTIERDETPANSPFPPDTAAYCGKADINIRACGLPANHHGQCDGNPPRGAPGRLPTVNR